MIQQVHATLFDAIKSQEQHFKLVLHSAIQKALIDLGSQVYELEWANAAVRVEFSKAKAA